MKLWFIRPWFGALIPYHVFIIPCFSYQYKNIFRKFPRFFSASRTGLAVAPVKARASDRRKRLGLDRLPAPQTLSQQRAAPCPPAQRRARGCGGRAPAEMGVQRGEAPLLGAMGAKPPDTRGCKGQRPLWWRVGSVGLPGTRCRRAQRVVIVASASRERACLRRAVLPYGRS